MAPAAVARMGLLLAPCAQLLPSTSACMSKSCAGGTRSSGPLQQQRPQAVNASPLPPPRSRWVLSRSLQLAVLTDRAKWLTHELAKKKYRLRDTDFGAFERPSAAQRILPGGLPARLPAPLCACQHAAPRLLCLLFSLPAMMCTHVATLSSLRLQPGGCAGNVSTTGPQLAGRALAACCARPHQMTPGCLVWALLQSGCWSAVTVATATHCTHASRLVACSKLLHRSHWMAAPPAAAVASA